MDKNLVTSIFSPTPFLLGTALLITTLLTGCVTQKYENDTPVVQNQANRDEMAATRISLGLGYLKMGNMAQAKLNLEKAKTFSPQLVQVYTAFAHYYEVVGENDLTSQSYEKALSIKADDADTLNNYGVFLCRQNKIAEAEVQLLKAIAVPTYLLVAQSYENLASCYLQVDNFIKAEQYLNKAISHSPNRTATLLQMVRLQYAMGEYEEAKVFQQKFERNTRRFTSDSLALAFKVYAKLGQRRTAKNYGAMLVKMYPQSWESKQYLLNELELIEADNLAKRYQLTQRRVDNQFSSEDTSSKKRIVKLSPKSKAEESAIASLAVIKATNTNSQNDEVESIDSSTLLFDADFEADNEIGTASSLSSSSKVSTPKVEVLPDEVASVIAGTSVLVASASNDFNTETSNVTVVDKTPTNDNTQNVTALQEDNTNEVVETPENTKESTEVVQTTKTEIDNLTGTLTHVSTVPQAVIVNNEIGKSSTGEPTSTKPIPATRDVPLPETIAYIAPNEAVLTEDNANQTIDDIVETNPDIEDVSELAAEVKVEVPAEMNSQPQLETITKEDKVIYHKVSDGETLYAISFKYNVKISALRKWNKITDKHKLQINEKIYVVNPETVISIND